MKNRKKKNFNSVSDLQRIVKVLNKAYDILGEAQKRSFMRLKAVWQVQLWD